MNQNNPDEGGWLILLYIPALIIGTVVGWYCGATLFFPAVGVCATLVVFKIKPLQKLRSFVAVFAIQLGQLFFMLAGGIAHPAQIGAVIYDVSILVIGLLWLAVRPGLLPLLFLGVYQSYALINNIERISQYQPGSLQHKAMVASIVLRTVAIIALAVGYVRFRKNESAKETQIQIHAKDQT